ncbi:FAD/NAD(P)-binding domain-containing protein, partial [Viridothelium virens]
PKNILIVGGSLGGLFAGTALTRLGHHVRILERNPTPLLHDQGAGIVAGGDTQAFFAKYDRSSRTTAKGKVDGLVVTSRARQYLDRRGEVIHFEERAQRMTSWDLLYHVLRAGFDGVESGYVEVPRRGEGEGNGVYEYGCMVTGWREVEGGVEVEYEKRVDEGKSELQKETADMLIACDGGSSTVRQILLPDVQRAYAGYVAWRGTVLESELSEEAAKTLAEKFTFYHAPALQILAYLIPGRNGTLEKGQRLMNYVWYCNYPEGSPEHNELMTDVHGKKHPVTVPVGGMQPKIWEQQQRHAKEVLPPQFAELVEKTKQPFVQAIMDVISPQQVFQGAKVLLLGDALAGFRPHTAASTSQAAFDAMTLADFMAGKLDLQGFEEECTSFAKSVQKAGVEMGDRSQFGDHPL